MGRHPWRRCPAEESARKGEHPKERRGQQGEGGRAPRRDGHLQSQQAKKNLGSSGRERALAWLEREGEEALEPGLTPQGPEGCWKAL